VQVGGSGALPVGLSLVGEPLLDQLQLIAQEHHVMQVISAISVELNAEPRNCVTAVRRPPPRDEPWRNAMPMPRTVPTKPIADRQTMTGSRKLGVRRSAFRADHMWVGRNILQAAGRAGSGAMRAAAHGAAARLRSCSGNAWIWREYSRVSGRIRTPSERQQVADRIGGARAPPAATCRQ